LGCQSKSWESWAARGVRGSLGLSEEEVGVLGCQKSGWESWASRGWGGSLGLLGNVAGVCLWVCQGAEGVFGGARECGGSLGLSVEGVGVLVRGKG
jgi:hypothetical protein